MALNGILEELENGIERSVFANDLAIYITIIWAPKISPYIEVKTLLENCISEIRMYFINNFLKINGSKKRLY